MLNPRTMFRSALLLSSVFALSSLTACVQDDTQNEERATLTASLGEDPDRNSDGERDLDAERDGEQVAQERPDGERDCEGACEARGAAIFQSCVDAGGAERDCAKRGRRYAASCVENYCADGDGDGGGVCEDRCYNAADDFFNTCLREGGDDEACARRARQWAGQCVEENCVDDMSDPPNRCETRCQERARLSFNSCIRRGGDPGRCRLIAHEQLETCLADNCEEDERPVDRCEAACTVRAQESYRICVRRGGDTGRCAQIARAELAECLGEYCSDEEPPADRCDAYCSAFGLRTLNACVDSGRDEILCARYARSETAQCQERCENIEPNEDDVCEDRCNAQAEEQYTSCVRADGDEEACAERARHNAGSCIEAYCTDDERTDDEREAGGERGGR